MARAVGYQLSFGIVQVPARDTGWVLLTLRPFTSALAPIEVTAEPVEAVTYPEFERRRAAGLGYFITGVEVRAAAPITLSQFLRRFPVVRVHDSLGVPQAVSGRGRKLVASGQVVVPVPCVMRMAVDGQLMPAGTSLDLVAPTSVGAIEIYPGPATIPVEYLGQSRDLGCGLIVVWTRRR